MASVVLHPDLQRFPAGTTVKAYPRANFPAVGPVAGAPVGAQAASATVATDGSVTFTGLDYETRYVLYGLVSSEHRYAGFTAPEAPSLAAQLSADPADEGKVLDAYTGLPRAAVDLTADLGPFDVGVGPLVTSPNGRKQRRIGIDDTGALVLTNPLPFAPDDIAGLQAWFAADEIVGLANADPVASWPDLSSGAHHAVQATAGKRPTYRTNVINGKPVVRFDGVDDVLSSPASASLKPFTIVAVLKAIAYLNGGIYCSQNGGIELRLNDPTGRPNLDVQATAGIGTATAAPALATPAVVIATYSGAGLYAFYIDGTLVGTATNDQNFTAGKTLVIGGRDAGDGDNYSGDIAELIAYDTVLSAGNRADVEGYLRTKYGTP